MSGNKDVVEACVRRKSKVEKDSLDIRVQKLKGRRQDKAQWMTEWHVEDVGQGQEVRRDNLDIRIQKQEGRYAEAKAQEGSETGAKTGA